MDRLVGEIEHIDGIIEGELISDMPVLKGVIETIDSFPSLTGELVIQPTMEVEAPIYDGSYVITPLVATDTILQTAGKKMEDDVTVLEIPYYETTNESGGYTVIIG